MTHKHLHRFATLQPFSATNENMHLQPLYLIVDIYNYSCKVAFIVKTAFNTMSAQIFVQLFSCKKLQKVAKGCKASKNTYKS
jgi:hypothetical protein